MLPLHALRALPLALLALALALLLATRSDVYTSVMVVDARLVGSLLISRHGTRAPNAVVADVCPGNIPNIERYSQLDISAEGVTGRGMTQLVQLGVETRARYVETGFIQPHFDNAEVYIRSVAEDRTLQSAVAWGHGLFPARHAAQGYPTSLPAPLPIYSWPNDVDTLLENRKAGCHPRLKRDVKEWDRTSLDGLLAEYPTLLDDMARFCGVSSLSASILNTSENLGDAIKDITDQWAFDLLEDFPPPHADLTADKVLELRTFAVRMLMGRLLRTDEQITYMNGDLPENMVEVLADFADNYIAFATGVTKREGLKLVAYHGHREMTYALAAFFDIRVNISFPALPVGGVPPATTFFFELHDVSRGEADESSSSSHSGKGGKGKDGGGAYRAHHTAGQGPARVATAEEESRVNASTARFVVRPLLWVPCVNVAVDARAHEQHGSVAAGHTSACPAVPIRMHKCSALDCPLDEFVSIVRSRIAATGEWRSLCTEPKPVPSAISVPFDEPAPHSILSSPDAGADHSIAAQAAAAAQPAADDATYSTNEAASASSSSSSSSSWAWFGYLMLAAVVLAAAYWFFVHRAAADRIEYHSLP